MPGREEQTGAHIVVAASACLYSAMLVVTLLRLLHHFAARPPSPFGTRKLFHVLLATAYALRVVSWTSLALSDDPAAPTAPEWLCAGLATPLFHAACATAAYDVLRRLTPPPRARRCLHARRRALAALFWALALTPPALLAAHCAACARTPRPRHTAQTRPMTALAAAALALAAAGVVAVALATAVGWPAPPPRGHAPGAHAPGAHARGHWRRCVLPGALGAAAGALLVQLGTALHCTLAHTVPAPGVAAALLCWVPELVPTGAALLYAMRARDTRARTPLPVGTHDDPDDWHIVHDSTAPAPPQPHDGSPDDTAAGLESAVAAAAAAAAAAATVVMPPRAPSAGLEQEGARTLAVPEYRAQIVAGTAPARAIVVLTHWPDDGGAAAPWEPLVFHDVPPAAEVDRTEVLGNDGRSGAPLVFCKTLLVPDRVLAPGRARVLAAVFSLRDPAAPVCAGCQWVAPEHLCGTPLALVPPETLLRDRSSSGGGTRRGVRRMQSTRAASGDLTARLLDSSMHIEGGTGSSSSSSSRAQAARAHLRRSLSFFDGSRSRGTSPQTGAAAPSEGLAVVLERQGLVAVQPKSAQTGGCVRTFQLVGQISGPAVRISVRQELWQSANAFELPRQVLQHLLARRRAQLAAFQRDVRRLQDTTEASATTATTTTSQEEASSPSKMLLVAHAEDGDDGNEDALSAAEDLAATAALEQQYAAVVACFAAHVAAMARAVDAYSVAQLRWSFKPSVRKFDRALCFVPTNLHTEVMTVHTTKKTAPAVRVLAPAAYAFVTLGVPAALVYRAPENGARDLRERLAALRAHTAGPAARHAALERRAVALLLAMRRDVTRTQVFAAVADSFTAELESRMMTVAAIQGGESSNCGADDDDYSAQGTTTTTTTTTITTSESGSSGNCLTEFLEQVDSCGFLVQFESLLSTRGKERAMIGDFEDAVRMVRTVALRLREDTAERTFVHGASIAAHHHAAAEPETDTDIDLDAETETDANDTWIVEIACPRCVFASAPARLRAGGLVAVHGVLVTQGINEQQTVANVLGDAALQDAVNREAVPALEAYFARYAAWLRARTGAPAPAAVEARLAALGAALGRLARTAQRRSLRTAKNTELLPGVADFCRALGGGRCTACKSGKDRTAMSVTWEEARILGARHGLPGAARGDAMRALRDAGVRRFNVVKNTGDSWYAFNPLQHKMLPAVYRAPKSSRLSVLVNNIAT